MTTKILDGKKSAAAWEKRLRGKFRATGRLAAILVGDNPASVMYLKKKQAMAESLGAQFELHKFPARTAQATIIRQIHKLNQDKRVVGIMIQLPLPVRLDTAAVVNTIAPNKDVDGLTDASIASGQFLPATARGILQLLADYRVTLSGKRIALVGFTRLLNIPLSVYLARQNNAVVVLQKGTRDIAELKTADIIVTAAGQPKLITGKYIKPGAIVVDAGIAKLGNKIVGDAEVDSVKRQAGYLTPVPGGVGPMTVVALYDNLLQSAKTRY